MTITKLHQVTAFSCRFLKKVQFCLQKFEVKNESVDCEVYKKPNVKRLYTCNHRTQESIPVPTMMIG